MFSRSSSPRAGRAAAAFLLALAAAPGTSLGAGVPAEADAEVRALKQELVALNRELFLLEEELLFPASTQVAVYVSMDVGEFFALDAVELSIDGEPVAKYLYTEREVDALHRGGVHRLYTGNLRTGRHELVAVFTGRGPQGRAYRRATSLEFEKGLGPQQLELAISDELANQQPAFSARTWE